MSLDAFPRLEQLKISDQYYMTEQLMQLSDPTAVIRFDELPITQYKYSFIYLLQIIEQIPFKVMAKERIHRMKELVRVIF